MFKSHPLLDQGFNHISLITAPFRLVRRFGCGSLLVLVLSLLSARPADAQNTLTIDVNSSTGPILHGASGWLYGQAEVDIPSENLMAPLKPQISAQKPPQGIQHPGGDALQVMPSFLRSGGTEMQIYMQDYFATFYPNPGIASYTQIVQQIVQALKSSPDFQSFVYVPFNEPDGVVYGKYGTGMTNLSGFESDWRTIYHMIRAINPSARIAGPNFYLYDHNKFASFMAFAKSNNVLPDEVTWHELTDSVYANWYSEYSDYRSLEASLAISPIKVVINEYGRPPDLAVPGQLIQYMARFERSKVFACLAYWGTSGNLSSLGANSMPNHATGGWWLYRWYSQMEGDTLAVTPPSDRAQGLQGMAVLDDNTKQVRAIVGGVSGNVNVDLRGLSSKPFFGSRVHVSVWGVDNTSTSPSPGPYYIQEADYTESNGKVRITVQDAQTNSAYYLVVTPATSLSKVDKANRYEAEYAELSGNATVAYGDAKGYSGTSFVGGYGNDGNATSEFDVNAPTGGYYKVTLRYASPNDPGDLELKLNGASLRTIALAGTGSSSTWTDASARLFLTAGINRIAYRAIPGKTNNGLALDYIDVTPAEGDIVTYRASSNVNTLGGAASVRQDSNAPGGDYVTSIGQGVENYLQFNNVSVPTAGLYRMIVTYSNGELYNRPGANTTLSNSQGEVYRFAQIAINGETASHVYFANTFSGEIYLPMEIDVQLKPGNNTIRFLNSTTSPTPNIESGWAPNIASIQIAAPE